MATTITIGGASIDPVEFPLGRFAIWMKGGCPHGTISRRGGQLPGLPDPWLGKEIVIAVGGTTYFVGEVTCAGEPQMTRIGWVIPYTCLGQRYLMDKFPITDDNNGGDTIAFNLDPQDSLNYIASRAGRNVGQILTFVLTSATNAFNLNAYGLGDYASFGPAVLPAATIADLAAMTFIPPGPVYVGGQKFGGGIEGFLEQWAPNYALWIDPTTGTLRFLDVRSFSSSPVTFTLNSDPIETTALTRDVSGCFQRVLLRGGPLAEAWLMTLLNGQLVEDFAYGSLSNSAAKAAFVAANNGQQGAYQDSGTCTCPSTTTITVTSSDPTVAYPANFWAGGSVNLVDPVGTGFNVQAQRRAIANTAMVAGGTSTWTVDLPLPVTSYTLFQVYGNNTGPGIVYRKYKAANATAGAALQAQFSYPQPFVSANGLLAALTSTPSGSVVYGSAPFFEFPLSFRIDPSDGSFMFDKPTYIVAGNAVPHDVRVLAAVAVGANQIASPRDVAGVPQFAGTSNAMEGLTDTLIVTVPAWKDPGNAANMGLYADDLLDTVKDGNMEGSVRYKGLYLPALTPGIAVNIAGNGYTTGWESGTLAAIPVTATELEWGYEGAMDHHTYMHVSNRRSAFGSGAFLRPSRTGLSFGSSDSGAVTGQAAGGAMARGASDLSGIGAAASADPAADAARRADDLGGSSSAGDGDGGGAGKKRSPEERAAAAKREREEGVERRKAKQETYSPEGRVASAKDERERHAAGLALRKQEEEAAAERRSEKQDALPEGAGQLVQPETPTEARNRQQEQARAPDDDRAGDLGKPKDVSPAERERIAGLGKPKDADPPDYTGG
jgi:hypothetical protein